MLFSCKITHSILLSLDRRGEDLTPVYESCDWPSEFLHDPSSWLEADKMEALLAQLERQFGLRPSVEQSLITDVGHQSKDLRAWGPLDSVLRMVPSSKDFFAQPDRFLSYFISPAPPIAEVQREGETVSFVLPISSESYPLVTMYLASVLEALPTYISKPMAQVSWVDSRVTIRWTDTQENLFPPEEVSLNPEFVNTILHTLETNQKELEVTKQRLSEREAELDVFRGIPMKGRGSEAVAAALHELYRLGDYFARGQQLVTLLVAQGRETPQVREAMRRVDWPSVCESAPAVIRDAINQLQAAQVHLKNMPATPKGESPQGSLFGSGSGPSAVASATQRMHS